MCGLIGIAVSDSYTKMNNQRLGLFIETAALVSATRGTDGTGLALVRKPKEQAMVYKDGIPAWNFLETKKWFDASKSLGGVHAALIHTRKATIGGTSYANTHPFVSGPVTLEHNGTLRTYPRDVGTDSEWLCKNISDSKDVLGALEAVDGAYALVWHNATTGEINITRNDERPLVIMSCEDGGIVMWASEEWMLDACASRIGLFSSQDVEVFDLPPGELMTIKLGSKLSITKRTYTPMPRVAAYTNYYGGYTKPNNTQLAVVPKIKLPNGWSVGTELHFCVEEQAESFIGQRTFVKISGAVLEDSEEYIEATATITAKEWDKYGDVVEPVFSGKVSVVRELAFPKGGAKYTQVTLTDVKFVGRYLDVESKFLIGDPTTPMYEGPWGEKLTAADVIEFLEKGCVCCNSPLYLEDVENGRVSWDDEGDPLCLECAPPVTTVN